MTPTGQSWEDIFAGLQILGGALLYNYAPQLGYALIQSGVNHIVQTGIAVITMGVSWNEASQGVGVGMGGTFTTGWGQYNNQVQAPQGENYNDYDRAVAAKYNYNSESDAYYNGMATAQKGGVGGGVPSFEKFQDWYNKAVNGMTKMFEEGGSGPPVKGDAVYSNRTNSLGFGWQRVLDFDFRLQSREETYSVWSGYNDGKSRVTSGISFDVGFGMTAFAHEYKDGVKSVTLGVALVGFGADIEFNRYSIRDYNFNFGTGFYSTLPDGRTHSGSIQVGLYKR
jgi:hypothetical protein